MKATLCCSFCGKGDDETKTLIAGPSAYICGECIELCQSVVAKEAGVTATAEQSRIIAAILRLPADVLPPPELDDNALQLWLQKRFKPIID